MTPQPIITRRSKVLGAFLLSALVLSMLWQRQSAEAQVTEVTGSAYGFFTSLSLFGGPPTVIGPIPTVSLPADGSSTPITATSNGESAVIGPAVLVESDTITVSTEGTTGDNGSVASSSMVGFPLPQEDQVDPFNADSVSASCTADASGTTATVSLKNASLVTKTDDVEGDPVDTMDVAETPAPNTIAGGTIDNISDTFRVVFNEQIEENGVITVNAVHFFFGQNAQGEEVSGGPAVGELIVGQAVCGVAASGAGGGATTTTAGSGGATTTTAAGGSSATTRPTATTAPSSSSASTTPAQPKFTG